MGTALVFLLVLALCGFIAYIGDLLGRRLGKKRLTVFGLRPKHTAILLTIVTGVVIASTTLGLALLIVPGFSKVVTQGERMLAINSRLTHENDGLQKQNESLRKDTAEEKKRNDQLSGQNVELTKKNGELQKSNDTIAAQNAALAKANQGLTAGNTQLKGQNQALSTGNKKLVGVNQELQKQRKSLFLVVDSLRQESISLRGGHYLFRAQEDIVRRPMPPNPPRDIVAETIKLLDFEVRSEAAKLMSDRRGQKVDPKSIETRLVPPPGFLTAPSERVLLEKWLSQRASTIRDTQILWRAVAAQNCIEDRPVVFYIDPFPNRLVFKRGEVLATTRIDGRSPRWQILYELIHFLQGEVRTLVTAPPNNMLPPGSQGLGELNLEPIVDTMDEISLRPGFVTVSAVTTTDVNRASPLNVEFQVNPSDF